MTVKKLIIVGLTLSTVATASAETFTQLTPTSCPTSSNGLFTTGQQYLDPNNGVLLGSWSMLVRWQSSTVTVGPTQWITSSLNYNAGTYTNYTPPTPFSSWQRGYQPESQAAATPGVQLHCFDAGMIINTWYTPHSGSPVVGGAFNDMYGYAWNTASGPFAFKHLFLGSFIPNELVLQGNLAVPAMQGFTGTKQPDGTYAWAPVADINADPLSFGSAQYDLFAYLQDSAHPNLHPIAVVIGAYGNGSPAFQCPSTGNVFWDYPQGVWATSTGFCTTDISTVRSTVGHTTNQLFLTPTMYRIHLTPQNWTNLISRINNLQCTAGQSNSCLTPSHLPCLPGSTCPQIGYSTDPNDYRLQYMGVIAEVALCDHANGCSTNIPDSQVGFAVNASQVKAFSYTTN